MSGFIGGWRLSLPPLVHPVKKTPSSDVRRTGYTKKSEQEKFSYWRT
jgi:hypothetical protein